MDKRRRERNEPSRDEKKDIPLIEQPFHRDAAVVFHGAKERLCRPPPRKGKMVVSAGPVGAAASSSGGSSARIFLGEGGEGRKPLLFATGNGQYLSSWGKM